MQSAEAIVPAIETLVQIEGTLDRPVTNLRFERITFSYTTWMRPSVKGHVPLQAGMYLTDGYRIDPKMKRNYKNHPLDNQGWLGRPAAAVRVAAAGEKTRITPFRINNWQTCHQQNRDQCRCQISIPKRILFLSHAITTFLNSSIQSLLSTA